MDKFWLLIIVTGIYWLGCAAIGIFTFNRRVKKPADYFLAGRGLGGFVLSLAMMATVFSAWFILGHQGLTYAQGFSYIAHYAHIPLMAMISIVLFSRIWAVGRRFEFVTPSEMFGTYFNSEFIRILIVILAAFYAIPYVALQLRGAGYVFNVLSGGEVPAVQGAVVLGIVVILYVFLGGLKAAAITDTLQGILLWVGGFLLAMTAIYVLMDKSGDSGWLFQWSEGARAAGDSYITMPAAGNMWSWPYCISIAFATAGIYTSPAFCMWTFAAGSPRIFRFQGLFVMALAMGVMYFFFSPLIGVGGRSIIDHLANTDALTLELIFNHMGPIPFVITAVGILAAMNSTAAAYLANTSTILARDIYLRYINPSASPQKQVLMGRLMVLFIVCLAVIFSMSVLDYLVLLGTLATAFGLLMTPSLLAVAYMPGITRAGVISGIVGGIIAIILTYFVWRHPLGIHTGGWGFIANVVLCSIVSLNSNKVPKEQVAKFHGIWDKDIAAGSLETSSK
jgi:Na+/proline symporter